MGDVSNRGKIKRFWRLPKGKVSLSLFVALLFVLFVAVYLKSDKSIIDRDTCSNISEATYKSLISGNKKQYVETYKKNVGICSIDASQASYQSLKTREKESLILLHANIAYGYYENKEQVKAAEFAHNVITLYKSMSREERQSSGLAIYVIEMEDIINEEL